MAKEQHPLTDSQSESIEFEQFIEQKQYQALKQLLFSNEEQRLKQVEHYLQNPTAYAEKIAQVLPRSIERSDPQALHDALNDLVQNCIIESVRNDSTMYTEALYPVILPAIKKSIAEAFKEMMQSLNYALEQGLSLNRFAWHFEAWRSGVPYREVVLRHTLAYRVEQVFLIHRETGLLLSHHAMDGLDQMRDSDAVSAMLTAIQDFISDSFSSDENDLLDNVEIGNYQVFLSRGAYAILASVVKGIAPYSLRQQFDNTLNDIHKLHTPLLKSFDGDSSGLVALEPYLSRCLVSETVKESKRKRSPKLVIAIFTILFIAFSYWRYTYWEFGQRAESYIQMLQQRVGIVITDYDYSDKILHIKGLYDTSTLHPDNQSQDFFIPKNKRDSHWQAYQSLEPALIKRRLVTLLKPPETVFIDIKHNQAYFSGVTSQEWINKLAFLNPNILGLTSFDTEQLKNHQRYLLDVLQPPASVKLEFDGTDLILTGTVSINWLKTAVKKRRELFFVKAYQREHLVIEEQQQLGQLLVKLESTAIYFAADRFDLEDKAQVMDMVGSLKRLLDLTQKLEKTAQIIVTGYTDEVGKFERNQTLANNRALYITQLLQEQGINKQLLSIDIKPALPEKKSKKGNYLQRKVDVKISLLKEKK